MKGFFKNISPFNNKTDMQDVLFIVKKILAFWFCYISGLFIAEGIAILLHFACGKNMLIGETFDFQNMLLIKYYGYAVVIATVLVYWKVVEKKRLSNMGVTNGFGSFFIGIIVAFCLLLISVGIIVLTGNMKYWGIFQNINILMIILFIGGFIIQGAMEEVLCRGFLLYTLKEKVSLPVAVLMSTVMFILPHWSSLFAGKVIYGVSGIINLVLISIIFSLLTIHYKSIWAACGLHSFWNAVLYSVLGLNLSGNDETFMAVFNLQSVGENIWNGGVYGIEASGVTTVVLALFVVLLLQMMKCTNLRNSSEE